MEDIQIINLYFARSEAAIAATSEKYGGYLYCIALNIVKNHEDSEEIVNDTYNGAWNVIPPKWPIPLKTFLARITRNISFDKLEYLLAKKRNAELEVLLSEAVECIPANTNVEKEWALQEVGKSINRFLSQIDRESRIIFVRRYWYGDSIKDIKKRFSLSESKIKNNLYRTRKQLKKFLESEGVVI